MWHLPQLSGWRACSDEKECRLWQAEQEPSDPSGLMRPMPVLGHVAGSSLPSPRTLIWEPWHCQQPFTAAALLPPGKPGVTMPRLPSTTSARTLSSDPRMRPPLEWWEDANSRASSSWQRAQSLGETIVAIASPSCSNASGSPSLAAWHS